MRLPQASREREARLPLGCLGRRGHRATSTSQAPGRELESGWCRAVSAWLASAGVGNGGVVFASDDHDSAYIDLTQWINQATEPENHDSAVSRCRRCPHPAKSERPPHQKPARVHFPVLGSRRGGLAVRSAHSRRARAARRSRGHRYGLTACGVQARSLRLRRKIHCLLDGDCSSAPSSEPLRLEQVPARPPVPLP